MSRSITFGPLDGPPTTPTKTSLHHDSDNPYLSEVLELDPMILERCKPSGWKLEMPPIGPFAARNKLVKQYAWSIPSPQAIEALVSRGPIIEVFAGTGYWASLIKKAGGDIIATDLKPGRNEWCDANPPYTSISELGAVAAAIAFPERMLFMSWPPMDDAAYRCLRAYQGPRLAYIGENAGGCTASDKFFDEVEGPFWEHEETISIPQWFGLHDTLNFYRRIE